MASTTFYFVEDVAVVSPHSLISDVCPKTPVRAQGVAILRRARSRSPVAAAAVPRPDRDYLGTPCSQVHIIGAIDQHRRAFAPVM